MVCRWKTIFLPVLALVLSSCASQFAKQYVGKDVVDIELDNGKPANIVELPDGRRFYQYYWGGGTFVTPQSTTGTISTIGNTAFISTQTSPAVAVNSPGCLINFIAMKREDRWIVIEARWPDRMFC
jgi:hypothetical protein